MVSRYFKSFPSAYWPFFLAVQNGLPFQPRKLCSWTIFRAGQEGIFPFLIWFGNQTCLKKDRETPKNGFQSYFPNGFLHTCTLFHMYLWTSPSHHLPTNAHPSQRQLLSHGTNRHNHWSHKHKKASVFWSLWLRKPTKVDVFLAMRFWCLPRIYWNRIGWISLFERHDFGRFQKSVFFCRLMQFALCALFFP